MKSPEERYGSGPEHAGAILSSLDPAKRTAWMYTLLCGIELWMGRGELWAVVRRHQARWLAFEEALQEPPD